MASIVDAEAQLFKKKVKDEQEPFGLFMEGKKNTLVIPFELVSNLIVVKVKIDHVDSLNFILDTGVSNIIITEPSLKDSINAQIYRKVEISGGGEDTVVAGISIGHKFSLNSITAFQQNLVILETDILQLSSYLGMPIHGIFGSDLFEHFAVQINYKSRYLELRKFEEFKPKAKYGQRVNLTINNNKPFINDFEITDKTGSKSNITMVLDTGAGHALLFDDSKEEITRPDKTIMVGLGRGLNGEIMGDLGRLKAAKLGHTRFQDVLASYPVSSAYGEKFPPNEIERHGSIGGEFLRRFILTFNYKEGYVLVKPIKMYLKKPFEHDMSGLDIRAAGDKLEKMVVKYIVNDSPAAEAGLMIDDELIFINDQKVDELSIAEVSQLLSQRENKTINMIVKRKGALLLCTFKLKRVI